MAGFLTSMAVESEKSEATCPVPALSSHHDPGSTHCHDMRHWQTHCHLMRENVFRRGASPQGKT